MLVKYYYSYYHYSHCGVRRPTLTRVVADSLTFKQRGLQRSESTRVHPQRAMVATGNHESYSISYDSLVQTTSSGTMTCNKMEEKVVCKIA